MTVRKNNKAPRGSLDAALEALPDRFREAEVYADNGEMTGLRVYMADLTEHLRQEMGIDEPPTVEAMTALGIPPSEWYRAMLTNTEKRAL
jgi:hypothetical protein